MHSLHQASPSNIDELIEAANIAFDIISPEILDNTFLSLQQLMLEAMKNDDSHNFKLTDIKKAKLRSQEIHL